MVTTILDKFDVVSVCDWGHIQFVRLKIYFMFRELVVITEQFFMIKAKLVNAPRYLDHFFDIPVLPHSGSSISTLIYLQTSVLFWNPRW